MSTQMGPGPEPPPHDFTPYPYPATTADTEAPAQVSSERIRAAIRQALADHAPAGKRYGPGGEITKICRCDLETDGATLTPRTQHLEDVITASVLTALRDGAAR